ncbi:VCBS domain-containing protein [Vibrio lentus]|nr:VCBS domain-containing protein [Vibrio lentus]
MAMINGATLLTTPIVKYKVLKDGQSLTESITLITADGTRIPITATIQGSDDHVIIDTPNAVTTSLGTAIEDTKTSISWHVGSTRC